MKSHYKRILKFVAWGVAALLVVKFLLFFNEVSNIDLCAERGSGKTTIACQVLDRYTHKPLDSVQLIIRYGASMDRLVDTLLLQKDCITYSFDIPEGDCEGYWLDVANKHYWHEVQFEDRSGGNLKKGQLNELTAWLTPATTIQITVARTRGSTTADTAFLFITPKDSSTLDRMLYYTHDDFRDPDSTDFPPSSYIINDNGKIRKITSDWEYFSGPVYKVHWIRKMENYLDTVYSEFTAKPFDTVRLEYSFPNP